MFTLYSEIIGVLLYIACYYLLLQKNDDFQVTNQFLYGCYMPPYYSVLNLLLMEKLIAYRQNPNSIAKILAVNK